MLSQSRIGRFVAVDCPSEYTLLLVYAIDRSDVVNEEVPRDAVTTRIYNYTSSNYKPCSWYQLGEKFFKNEKNVSSPNFVRNRMISRKYIVPRFRKAMHFFFQFWMPFYYVTNSILFYWIMTFCLHTVPGKIVDSYIWLLGKEPRRVVYLYIYIE